jgi:hypothetical protein
MAIWDKAVVAYLKTSVQNNGIRIHLKNVSVFDFVRPLFPISLSTF